MQQNNSLTDMLNALDSDSLARLLEGVDEKRLGTSRAATVRRRARERLALSKKRPRRALLRTLVPVAACLIVLAVLFSIPSVSKAVSDWFYETFRVGRYFMEPSSERDQNEDVEKAVFTPQPSDQAFTIRYLDELPIYEEVAAWRKANGFKPFDRKDYAWIADLAPRSEEALYDGEQLIVNTVFSVSPLRFIAGYTTQEIPNAERFDIWAQDARVTINGITEDLYPDDSGLTIPWVYQIDGTGNYDVDEIVNAETSCVQTSFSTGKSPAFPSGPVTVEIVYDVYDGSIDDMAMVGVVAKITERLTFDATSGNAMLAPASAVTQQLSGTAPLLFEYFGGEKADTLMTENRPVDFSCCTVAASATQRTTGLTVAINYSFSGGVDEEKYRGAFCQQLHYDLYVNGVRAERLKPIYGSFSREKADMTYEISLTPSDLQNVTSLALRPVAAYMSGYQPVKYHGPDTGYLPDGPVVTLSQDGAFDVPIDQNYTPEWTETALTGCDIVLPLH